MQENVLWRAECSQVLGEDWLISRSGCDSVPMGRSNAQQRCDTALRLHRAHCDAYRGTIATVARRKGSAAAGLL